ncbi:hypothetical protein [Ralstonia pseudosolanacearum]|uniref:hypothetical protein n=1 Tax=Ralstonia pseudosolanacearum TaxID=1310165 RepID=UPI003867DC60
MSLLPLDVADEAGQVLFEAVARFLSEWGGELSFEDIDAVAGALFDFDVDAAVVAHAHQNALRKRTSDLSSILLDYGSVDDLDSFESELTLLMTKNSVPPGDVAAQVERRREILVEREQEREDESYNPAQSVSPWQSATDQIRSMFAGLAAE